MMETKPTYEINQTNQTKALTVVQPLTPATWDMLMAIATATTESRQYGMFKPEEAAIKMLVAYEHGIPLTSALSAVYVIDKKPTLAPALLWAKVLASPDFDSYEEKRLEKSGAFFGWEITLKRKNDHQATRRFTLDDAARAGLINKPNWKNYPEDVCYWRTIERAIKVVFGDIAQGLHTADELGAEITPAGDVIEGAWTVATVSAPEPKAPEPNSEPLPPFSTLDELLERWSTEQIMAATLDPETGFSAIPHTPEECQAVAAKLGLQNPIGGTADDSSVF